jgi:V8-like Glu-specific endopeptidase
MLQVLLLSSAIFSQSNCQQSALISPFSICGSDNTIEAKCANQTDPKIYEKSKAVLRVQKSGRIHCTAWLVGDQGHILTNYHCAENKYAGSMLKFEAMAEGSNCTVACRSKLACKGEFIHKNKLEFVTTGGSMDRDWTVFKLAPSEAIAAVSKYGYLKIRKSGAIQDERIYIVGHPMGQGKRISFVDGPSPATVLNSNFDTECGTSEVIYNLDTEGGNSGSPIIAISDHAVVGLHHCGKCDEYGNSAVNADKLYQSLKNILPASAWI